MLREGIDDNRTMNDFNMVKLQQQMKRSTTTLTAQSMTIRPD